MKLRDRKKASDISLEKEKKPANKSKPKPKRSKSADREPVPPKHSQVIEVEDEVVEIKKIKKPKKVVHSYEQASRIARGKTQRMFLLSVAREFASWDDKLVIWRSQVLGHSGSTYNVTISNTLSCTCPDYYRQRKPCKHIYFMISQVAQFDEFFDKMKNVLNLTRPKLQELDEALTKRLALRIKPKEDKKEEKVDKPDVELGDEVDCAICFEELDKTKELFQCEQCKKHFHGECMTAWKARNTTCPLCRHDLTQAYKKREAEEDEMIGNTDLDRDHPLKRLKLLSLT